MRAPKCGDVTSHCYNHVTVARLWAQDTVTDRGWTCSHGEGRFVLFSLVKGEFLFEFIVSTGGNVMCVTFVSMFVVSTGVDSGKCRLWLLEKRNRA